MRMRWIGLGIAVGLLLALTLGFTYRQTGSMMDGFGRTTSSSWDAMEAMHDSPWMQAMHDRIPPALRERCDALHDQMVSSGYGGMTGPGASGGPGMMGPGTSAGAGMMGSGGDGSV